MTAPDFVKLFPVPTNDDVTLEPKAAYALWVGLQVITDQLRQDADFVGGNRSFEEGIQVSRLPRFTWNQKRGWILGLVQAGKDLTEELAAGKLPYPRNVAEEVVLALGIRDGQGFYEEYIETEIEFNSLPEMTKDYDEDDLREILYQDVDFLLMFDPRFDGIEDATQMQKDLGIVNLLPERWFDWFANIEPRDPNRPLLYAFSPTGLKVLPNGFVQDGFLAELDAEAEVIKGQGFDRSMQAQRQMVRRVSELVLNEIADYMKKHEIVFATERPATTEN